MTDDPKEMRKAELLKEWAEKHGIKLVKREDPTGEYDIGALGLQMRDDRVNWWESPEERHDTVYYWDGEPWVTFYWACVEIKRELGLSKGVAQRTLRELCAKGKASRTWKGSVRVVGKGE